MHPFVADEPLPIVQAFSEGTSGHGEGDGQNSEEYHPKGGGGGSKIDDTQTAIYRSLRNPSDTFYIAMMHAFVADELILIVQALPEDTSKHGVGEGGLVHADQNSEEHHPKGGARGGGRKTGDTQTAIYRSLRNPSDAFCIAMMHAFVADERIPIVQASSEDTSGHGGGESQNSEGPHPKGGGSASKTGDAQTTIDSAQNASEETQALITEEIRAAEQAIEGAKAVLADKSTQQHGLPLYHHTVPSAQTPAGGSVEELLKRSESARRSAQHEIAEAEKQLGKSQHTGINIYPQLPHSETSPRVRTKIE